MNNTESRSKSKWFLTFGGGTDGYRHRTKVLSIQAFDFGEFDKIIGITDIELKNMDFWNHHGKFVETNKRGFGYWLWKPYLIKSCLENMQENDILLYIDSGCSLNKEGMERFNEYIDIVNNSEFGMISFQMPHLEKSYTKRIVFDYFKEHLDELKNPKFTHLTKSNFDELIGETGQCVGGIQIICKNDHSKKFVDLWYKLASNYNLINDSIYIQEHPEFKDHRHDQSIYSVLSKTLGTVKILDETFFHPDWQTKGIKYPIWATRIRN